MWAKIITIKRTKDLNYFSLCALNWFNTHFELNYWNKFTFPGHSNLLRCTCIFKHGLSDYMRQNLDFLKLYSLLTYLRMFIHVYFVMKLIWKQRCWSIHTHFPLLLLELRRYSDLSLHIKKRQNCIYCLNIVILWTESEIWDFLSCQK